MPNLSKMSGYAILIAMLPVAFLGIVGTANEYRAIGVDAVDCDGPLSVLLFAVPAMAVYGVSGSIFLYRFRRRGSLILGVICGLIFAALLWNIGDAVAEQWKNKTEAACPVEP
ncbi:putative membrane protein (GlpM family) [Rhizobium sp. AN70]|nr:putative membrane protein (GlpM family) [Rhizobium sp. AN70]